MTSSIRPIDGEANATDPDEFDRFHDLALRLVRVPKDGIDQKRAEEKARKG